MGEKGPEVRITSPVEGAPDERGDKSVAHLEGPAMVVRLEDGNVYATPEDQLELAAKGELKATGMVVRGVNSDRLTMLAVLVGIAMTLAFGIGGLDWYWRLVVGVGAFLGIATISHLLFRHERPTHLLMSFAHWILGGKH